MIEEDAVMSDEEIEFWMSRSIGNVPVFADIIEEYPGRFIIKLTTAGIGMETETVTADLNMDIGEVSRLVDKLLRYGFSTADEIRAAIADLEEQKCAHDNEEEDLI